MTTTEVYYPGESSTEHSLITLSPGINKLDSGIANELLKTGLVTMPPKRKGNPYQGKKGRFSTKKNDADGLPRYKKEK